MKPKEHAKDPYAKQAKKEGYRSRAVYKLQEIDKRDQLFSGKNLRVIDLGAAPGGWSQWAWQRMQGNGEIIAMDILPMESLPGVKFIQGDFTEDEIFDAVLETLGGAHANLVMSDMAPNISGIRAVDQPRAMYLAELALEFSTRCLTPGGHFLVKVFQGEGFDAYIKLMRSHFEKVLTRKPKASRDNSREVYVLAQHFRG
ncbi:MAG: RlmE family RNA methyltransferase [Pseudomonadota bacterium]